jgi:hypothetical protein
MILEAQGSEAHTIGISRGDYRISAPTAIHAEMTFARPEIAAAIPVLDVNRDGSVSPAEINAAGPMIAEVISSKLEVHRQDVPCERTFEEAFLTEEDGLAIRARYSCDAPITTAPISIRLNFLNTLSLGHRHIAAVTSPDGTLERIVVHEARPEIQISRTPSLAGVAWPLFGLGIEHILTGYDHVLFLFGLILVGGRLRALLIAVTAFTIAHSITLGVAALGVWAPSSRLVEPAIALSIAYVGIENWFFPDAGRRWLITFPFGLIHGFGFAGALTGISLPSVQIPVALASFNSGVEVGQIIVLAAILPAVLWLGRQRWFDGIGRQAANAAVVAAGLAWFADRVV